MGDSNRNRKRVVVVGCGFGGVSLARRLAQRASRQIEIIAFDSGPELYNYTVLPRTLVEATPRRRISVPLVKLFLGLPVDLRIQRIEGVDAERAVLHTQDSEMPYDYLVLATGARAYPLKRDDASYVLYPKSTRHLKRLREHITRATTTTHRRGPGQPAAHPYRFGVVGGGLTGIEFAIALREALDNAGSGACAERGACPVEIFEQSPRLFPAASKRFSHHLQAELESRGVRVRLNERVRRVERQRLVLDDRTIAADAVLSCIGSSSNLRMELSGLGDTTAGMQVNECLQSTADGQVFAIGDCADLAHLSNGSGTRFASQATRQGKLVAENILRLMSGDQMQAYASAQTPVGVMLGSRNASFALGEWFYTGRLAGSVKRYLERHVLGT